MPRGFLKKENSKYEIMIKTRVVVPEGDEEKDESIKIKRSVKNRLANLLNENLDESDHKSFKNLWDMFCETAKKNSSGKLVMPRREPPMRVKNSVASAEISLQQLVALKIFSLQSLCQAATFIDNSAKMCVKIIREKQFAGSRGDSWLNLGLKMENRHNQYGDDDFVRKIDSIIVNIAVAIEDKIFESLEWLTSGFKNSDWHLDKSTIKIVNSHIDTMVRVLQQNSNLKKLMSYQDLSAATNTDYLKETKKYHVKEKELIFDMVCENYEFVKRYQQKIFTTSNMSSEILLKEMKPAFEISDHLRVMKEAVEVLASCWKCCKGFLNWLVNSYPELRASVYRAYWNMIKDATISITDIQEEYQAPRPFRANFISTSIPEDEISVICQSWLVPALIKLHDSANKFTNDLKNAGTVPKIVESITFNFYHMMLMTLGRACWACLITQKKIEPSLKLMKNLNKQVSGVLELMIAYDKGMLSLDPKLVTTFKGMCLYDAFRAPLEFLISMKASLEESICAWKTWSDTKKSNSSCLSVDIVSTRYSNDGEVITPMSPIDNTSPFAMPHNQERMIALGNVEKREKVEDTSGSLTASTFGNPLFSKNLSFDESENTSLQNEEAVSFLKSLFETHESLEFWTVKTCDLVIKDEIDSGSAGKVYDGFYCQQPVAIKRLANALDSSINIKDFVKEVCIHKQLSHPNIVRFYGVCEYVKERIFGPGIVMEKCTMGSLLGIIDHAKHLKMLETEDFKDISKYSHNKGYRLYKDWGLRVMIACDMAAGLYYLHDRNIVHRDFTSYNVVITEDINKKWIAKVCDFELSHYVPPMLHIERSILQANSPCWMAPEIIKGESYSTQADVFSFGVVLYELLTLERPWRDQGFPDQFIDILVTAKVRDGESLEIQRDLFPDLKGFDQMADLISKCFRFNPDERPHMKEVFQELVNIKDSISQSQS